MAMITPRLQLPECCYDLVSGCTQAPASLGFPSAPEAMVFTSHVSALPLAGSVSKSFAAAGHVSEPHVASLNLCTRSPKFHQNFYPAIVYQVKEKEREPLSEVSKLICKLDIVTEVHCTFSRDANSRTRKRSQICDHNEEEVDVDVISANSHWSRCYLVELLMDV